MKPLATAAQAMPRSGIRIILDLANKIPDAIHLEIGQPNFPTPVHICEAAYQASLNGFTGYPPNAGYMSLREAIAEKISHELALPVAAEAITVTTGGMGGLYSSFITVLEPGDEILLPDPGYPNFEMISLLCHATAVKYPLDPKNGFQPILEVLPTLVTPRTKAILINSPSNPTGAVFPEKTIQWLVSFAAEHDLYMISDECYEKIMFDAKHYSPYRYDTEHRVICVNSFSKTYAMTGWRVGYVLSPMEIAPIISKLQEATVACTSSVSQKAAEAALKGPQNCVAEMNSAYHHRRDLSLAILREHAFPSYTPEGAFYLLVDISRTEMSSDQFALSLLNEKHVAVAPGATFGNGGKHYIRVSLASDDQALQEGLNRICDFIHEKAEK